MPFIRKLGRADLGRLKAHFGRLDSNDRYMRFGYQVSDSAMNAYLDRIDWSRSILLGYFDGGELRGVVEIVPGDHSPFVRRAELALTVQKPWREQGIGTELCRNGLIVACNRHIRDVDMICLAENVPMQRLAQRLDGRVMNRDSDVECRVALPHSSPWSLMQEGLIAGAAAVGGVTDQLLPYQDPGGSAGAQSAA